MSQVQSLLYSLCGGCCGCTSCELLISGRALTPLELPNLPVVVLIALHAPPFFAACIPLRPDMIAPLGVAVPLLSAEFCRRVRFLTTGGRGKDGSGPPGFSSANAGLFGHPFFWPRNLLQERYNSIEYLLSDRENPDKMAADRGFRS